MPPVAPYSRQIGYVLDQKDSRTKLRLSRLLSEVAQEPSTSSSEWHKLCVRISSLLHANQDVAKGLMLAMEMVENVPWEIITPHVSQWISSALTHFHLAIVESCAFLDNVLGQDAKAKAEYWRNTGSVQVPKYALALLEASREIDDIDPCLLSVLLQSIRKQARSHPATYRIHATELQSLCTQLLCRRADLTSDTGSLLSALHLTGKGQDIQCQLWKTTLKLLIDDAEIAWQACSSTFGVTRSDEHSDQGLLGSLPTDDMEALELAHQRLTLLLGQPPTPGIIAAFLSEPTQNVVPVPLDRLVSLVLAILSITPSSTPSQTPPPEATLLAAQTAMLPAAHVAALSLLANLPISVAFAKRVQIVSRVLRVIEKSSATIRCVAFRTLLVLDIPLNPESDIVIHCTRTCLAQAARLIHAKEGLDQILAKTTNGKTSGREIGPAKRRKVLYESDQVQFTQSRGFVDLCEDEYAGCITAIRLLPSLYSHLATHLSAEHHDLAHTTALVLLGVSEIALRRPDDLSDASLTVLAAIVRLSRGSILALLTTRAASLACQGLIALHHDTRQAAKALTHALEFTFNPRLPPKLSLRVHVAEDSRPADASETVLGNVELDEESGRKEWEAMRDVLQVQPYEPRSPSQYLQRLEGGEPMSGLAHADSPGLTSAHRKTSKAAAAGPPLSPDPVKPLHRPTTPRIGSPLHSASTSTGTTLSAGLSTASRASSISPERSSTNAHLFGGTSTSPIQSTSFPTSAASPHIQHQQEVQQQHRQQVSTDEDNISHADSDESALPEIDMRSSDEESEEEQS